jgi:LuxR family maltose regulon positive regulatory protein
VPGAWLSLDEEDNDLVQFTSYLLAAVCALYPDACPDTQALLQGATLPPLPVLARSLVNELDALDPPFVLVLDDYHLIHEAAIHELLDALLAHPPRPMHLVLTTRSDPPLSLARRRARSEVTEIRSGELRFTEDETLTFLRQELGGPVDERTVTALLQRVEGWVAGLRLAALSLRQRDSIDLFPARLGGGVPYVTEYLATEILKEQPPAVQAYLLRTSLLDRFCAPLCQAVCLGCADLSTPEGGAALDGQAFLELLARRNLFVIPLDDERTWYRYHHMLRELLQDELRRRLSAGDRGATLPGQRLAGRAWAGRRGAAPRPGCRRYRHSRAAGGRAPSPGDESRAVAPPAPLARPAAPRGG